MSDTTDAIVQTTDGPPRPGHNVKGEEVVWERWTKKRVFVEATAKQLAYTPPAGL